MGQLVSGPVNRRRSGAAAMLCFGQRQAAAGSYTVWDAVTTGIVTLLHCDILHLIARAFPPIRLTPT